VINRLSGFFSSPRQLLKGRELPLTGLLLSVGLIATILTLQAAGPRQQKQAVDSNPVGSTLETTTPEQVEPTLDSDSVGSTSNTTAPEQAEPTLDSNSAASTFNTATPEQAEPTLDSNSAASTFNTTTPEQAEPTLDSNAVAPTFETTAPEQAEPTFDSNAVAPTFKKAPPQPSKPVGESNAVAPTFKTAAPQPPAPPVDSKPVAIAKAPASNGSIADGTYLYGQSSEPGQVGKEYLIFEARQGKVIGAMFLPGSEYNCFNGTVDSNQLNLTVVNQYNQTALAHTIERAQPAQLAAVGGGINIEKTYESLSYPHTVGLDGYQPITKISDNDKQILNACRNKSQG